MVGFPVIVTSRSALVWLFRLFAVQVAFVPQMMSATVFVLPPVQPGVWVPVFGVPRPPTPKGVTPLLVHWPQSLSVTRIVAFGAIETPQAEPQLRSLNEISILSPWSSTFAKPPDELRIATVDVSVVAAGAPPVMVTNT